jgi:hypothetical protein
MSDLSSKLDAALAGETINEVVPLLAAYLANCGVHGLMPSTVLKGYINGVIDEVYAAFSAPTDKEKIQ